jgi:hypothetical protein
MKIEYMSLDEFESNYRSEIYQESETLIQDHLWWNEPLTLFDKIDYPLHLTGESNLVRDCLHDDYGPRREIKRKDDVYLALIDYAKIIEILQQLGEAHEITWRLFRRNAAGKDVDVGYITNGKSDTKAIDFLVSSLEQYGLSHESIWDEGLKDEVYSRYFDESDNPIY